MSAVSEIMSTDLQVIEPPENLGRAARSMQVFDIGDLPICDGHRLPGMVIDRDITARAVAEGLNAAQCSLSDVTSADLQFCTAHLDAQDVMRQMADRQTRRLPLIDTDRHLVGTVSLGDLALRQQGDIARTLRHISAPARADAGRV